MSFPGAGIVLRITLSILICAVATISFCGDVKLARKSSEVHVPECRISLIRHVPLASDRAGILKDVEFTEGQSVEAKQQVASIACDVAQAHLSIAEKKAANDVDIRYNKKARDVAVVEYQKNVEANDKAAGNGRSFVIPPLEIEKLKLAAQKSLLAIEQAEHELELNRLQAEEARAELATYKVQAPFSGVITRVYKQRGEAVRQGDPIVELVNVDRVRIEGRISIKDVRSVRPRQTVRIRLTDPDSKREGDPVEFKGVISFVDVVVDPVDKKCRVWAEADNRENFLRPGLSAEMTIELTEEATALR